MSLSYLSSLVADMDEECLFKQREGCLESWVPPLKNSKLLSSLIVGLLLGSFCKVELIKYLKQEDVCTVSGNVKIPLLIFLYVSFTSLDSKGGLP